MEPIKVVVYGASGRVGQEVIKAICQEPTTRLVGAVDVKASGDSLLLPDGSGKVPFATDLAVIIKRCRPDVIVDFTIAKATLAAVPVAAAQGVNMVIGTTGLTPDDIKEMERLAKERDVWTRTRANAALTYIYASQSAHRKVLAAYEARAERSLTRSSSWPVARIDARALR